MAHNPKTTYKTKKNLLKGTHSVTVTLTLNSNVLTSQMEKETEEELIGQALVNHLPRCLSENVDVTVCNIDVKVKEL